MGEQLDTIVIGGGVIGVCSAYYLQQEGQRVAILEQDEICSGSSHGNGGWLVPSHSVPFSRPGAVMRGLRWMFNPESPFYIKPRLNGELLRWLWRFRAASTARMVQASIPPLSELSIASNELYADLIAKEEVDCHYAQKGLIELYTTDEGLDEGAEEAEALAPHGITSRVLDPNEVVEMEPTIRPGVAAGAVYYEGDAHLKPDDLVHGLAERFEARGGAIHTNTKVVAFGVSNGKIAAVGTDQGDYQCDQVVLASGAWSPGVARDLRIDLPVQPAKGYSITFDEPADAPTTPIMLVEARVGVTPMGPVMRLAGTLELSGLNTTIDARRVAAIRRAGHEHLTTELSADGTVWCGMRPLTPDNLPIIGRVDSLSNLIVATGHSMTGVTLGAVTGKLVSQLVAGQPTVVDPAPFSPMRFQ